VSQNRLVTGESGGNPQQVRLAGSRDLKCAGFRDDTGGLARFRLPVAVLLPALSACVSDDISVREKGVPMATIRMSFREPVGQAVDAGGDAPSAVVAELGATLAWDDLGSENTGDFALLEAGVSARGGGWGSEEVRLDFIAGVAYSHLELEIESGGQTTSPSLNRYGPLFGAQISWEVIPRVALYGRGTYAWLIPDTTSGQAELGVRLAITDQVRLIGGYRHWRYRHEDLDIQGSTQADLDLEIDGYLFGFDLSF
jgi:hypothetical protein